MLVVHTRAEARAWSAGVRLAGERSALVPTMGSLHRGHTSLLELAAASADRVALSIFVNPLQFAPAEDFERYPRELTRDLEVAESAGVDLVFAPSAGEMYPFGRPSILVVPDRGADVLCGRSRPGHFQGELTVVAKLFGILMPDVAIFGQKDYQQLSLIRRMAADLDYPVDVRTGAIVRDDDGLALSSRNRYLSREDRERSLELFRALQDCTRLYEAGERNALEYRKRLHQVDRTGVSLEYGEVVDPDTLDSIDRVGEGSVCAIAARVGETRLIDNQILGTSPND